MMDIHDHSHGQEEVTVVMVPLPAQGHLNQLLHLSRLISSYNIPVHYVCTPAHTHQAKVRIHGWDPLSISNLHFHEIPVPPYQTPPPNPNDPSKFPTHIMPALFASLHLREPIFSLIQKFSTATKRLVVIHDSIMPYVIQDVHSIPNAESYNFQSISAFTTFSYFWELNGKKEGPECQLLFHNLPQNTTPEELAEFVRLQIEAKIINSGNLFNSCRAIEGPYLDLLAKCKGFNTDKNWAIGPFHPLEINEKENSKKSHWCLDWLDQQAQNSVIFVSFGSTTSLTDEQIREIAIGLEKSEQKFIWVVRDADRGHVLEGEVRKVQLPEGFDSSIEGRGIIEWGWAPQLEILAHSSTGGFMSHCGWNSCVESISHGVPIAAWPMHSDQPRNSMLLNEVLKIGLRVRDWSLRDEIVTSKAVEMAVRRLMDSAEGDELRQRAQELSKAVKTSIIEGASRMELDSFIAHIRR